MTTVSKVNNVFVATRLNTGGSDPEDSSVKVLGVFKNRKDAEEAIDTDIKSMFDEEDVIYDGDHDGEKLCDYGDGPAYKWEIHEV